VLAAQLLDRQAGIGLTQEANDLLLGESLFLSSNFLAGVIGLQIVMWLISGGSAAESDNALDGWSGRPPW
jgi:hypothetical protein